MCKKVRAVNHGMSFATPIIPAKHSHYVSLYEIITGDVGVAIHNYKTVKLNICWCTEVLIL